MARAFTFTVDTRGLDAKRREMAARVKDPSKPLRRWALEVAVEIAKAWDRMKFGSMFPTGKQFRDGIFWRGVKPMYVRKDGTRVPPWGGLSMAGRKRKGKRQVATDVATKQAVYGRVKGRKRPSGARVKAADVVGKDTHNLYKQFTRNPRLTKNGWRSYIDLVTNTDYAAAQNDLRPFNKPTKRDREALLRHLNEWLDELAVRLNRRRAARRGA